MSGAEHIFYLYLITYFDRKKVAKLSEKVGLYVRTLLKYTSMKVCKRVMLYTHAFRERITHCIYL